MKFKVDGIIIINKETGWTSNDVVQKIKHVFNEKVGHTGTLDPLATGVLPILVGKGTSLSKYLINHDKEYIATLKLGKKTTTGDSEGKIVEEKQVLEEMLEKNKVVKILNSFKGKQKQLPPMYSAIKISGKKLYEYARKGQAIEIPARDIEIYDIKLICILQEKQEIQYKVCCSKGTYIRTLSENIAERLGTVGFMKGLQRTRVGDFTIEQAVKISDINKIDKNKINFTEKNVEIGQEKDFRNIFKQSFISVEEFFADKQEITLENRRLQNFLNGVNLSIQKEDGIYKIYDENGYFIGTGILSKNKLKRDICI